MTKLQVELAKDKKRIKKAVRKHIDITEVTIAYGRWCVQVYAWLDSDIVGSVRADANATTKQIVQQVHQELGHKFVVEAANDAIFDRDIPF